MLTAARVFLAAALAFPAPRAHAESGADLSARVVVDGRTDEYSADEWVLDGPGEAGDSRWGNDNDVRRVAVTWDRARLYIAVECQTFDTELLLFVDHTGGGLTDMRTLSGLRRAIVFSGVAVDLVVRATPESEKAVAWRFGGDGAPEALADGALSSRFVQTTVAGGALEVAIPWSLVAPASGAVGLLAAITGDEGTGCGDAAPDPSALPGGERSDRVVLDRILRVVVDADGDGVPDAGVAPRDAASVSPDAAASTADGVALGVRPSVRSFAPDDGETLEFSLSRDGGVGVPRVYVTARVFSISGEIVRVLCRDDPRDFSAAAPPAEPSDAWDGRDRDGRVVPGGIYVLDVGWSTARGGRDGSARVSVAVVR